MTPTNETTYNPDISVEAALRHAHDLFGIHAATTKLFPSNLDFNLYIKTEEGREMVFKVMHPSTQRKKIELQTFTISHLTEHVPNLDFPTVYTSLAGKQIESISYEDGRCLVWVLGYVSGRVLERSGQESFVALRGIGRRLGEVGQAFKSFERPLVEQASMWHFEHTHLSMRYIPYVTDPTQRALAERILKGFVENTWERLAQTRWGVIHGDANADNTLLNVPDGSPYRMVGLIDFEDVNYAPLATEIAITCAYAIWQYDDPVAACAELVKGFHEVYPLTEEEIALLYSMINTRMCVSIVNAACRQAMEGVDPYIGTGENPKWIGLEAMIKVGEAGVESILRVACGYSA